MKENIIHIANNIVLHESEEVIVQGWIETNDAWMVDTFAKVLEQRGFIVRKAVMNEDTINACLTEGHLSPEKVYGDNWESVKNIVDLCQFSPPGLVRKFDEDKVDGFIQFMRKIFSSFVDEANNFMQIRVPSKENITMSGLSDTLYRESWENLVMADYEELAKKADQVLSNYAPMKGFEVITWDKEKREHKLLLSLGDRKWHKDIGNGDFPAGEVYIAPLETSVSGSFIASKVNWEGRVYDEVALTFEKGKLIHASEAVIKDDLAQAPGDSLTIGEFGVGLNAMMDSLTSYSLFDEKIEGTCHIAIGANTMFGGVNDTPVHIDFVASAFTVKERNDG